MQRRKGFVIRNQLVRELIAEVIGTWVLMTFGLGAGMQQRFSGNPPSVGVNMAWGFGVMLAIYVSCGVSGAHFNPAVSLSFTVIGKLPFWKLPLYCLAQVFGAFTASALIFITYYDAFYSRAGGLMVVSGVNATANLYATYPAPFLSTWNGFLDQVVGTAFLLITICAAIDKRNMNVPPYLMPIVIGLSVMVNGLSFGFNCGGAINPARDFGPRLFLFLAGWGAEAFSYKSFWWIPILGPLVGGVLGTGLYTLLIELHWPAEDEDTDIDQIKKKSNNIEMNNRWQPETVLLESSLKHREAVHSEK